MAQNYQTLLAFTQQNAGDPIALAKALTSWGWAALLPGGYGPTPERAEDVPEGLNASCGWRDVLMKSLFSEIGIESRRVNFYDVPYQGGHTATELKIGGKWMFFDATFGIYFTAKNSATPLSIAEVFKLWPSVDVMQSTLEGWQGSFIPPEAINSSDFAPVTDSALYMPFGFHNRDGILGGEINSLYLGPNTAYYINNTNYAVDAGKFTWKESFDALGRYDWLKITDRYQDGKLDTRSGLYDNGSRWFVDYDQNNEYSWSTHTTYVTANSRIDLREIVFDDGSRQTIDWDAQDSFDWQRIEDDYDSRGTLVSRTIINDDGTILIPNVISVAQATTPVAGTADDDLIVGFQSSSSATVDGGDGLDVALFTGTRASFGITFSGTGSATVKHGAASHELTSIQSLVFSDQIVMVPYYASTEYDANKEYAWLSVSTFRDHEFNILSVKYTLDNGNTQLYHYDTLNQFSWSRTITSLNSSNKKYMDIYDNDNGKRVIYQYSENSNEKWDRITYNLESNSNKNSINYNLKTGEIVTYQYDHNSSKSWSEISTYFARSGNREKVIYSNDDKSYTVYNYDHLENNPWNSIETHFSPTGTRTSVMYNQDDGNRVFYQFEEDGLTIASVYYFDQNWSLIA